MPLPPRFCRLSTVRWLLGLAVLTLCSWARFLGTGSVKIDENYPTERFGTLLLLAMCAGWGLAVWGWADLLKRPPQRPRRLAYAGLFVVCFMLPLLSNDLFILFNQAFLTAHGRDVYTSADSFPAGAWIAWVGERWRDNPSPYGPLTLLSAWPSVLGGTNPLRVELLLRLTWLVPLLLVMETSFRVFSDRPYFHAMLWLNPLFLVEGPGQLHPDLLGVLLVTAGMCLPRRSAALGGAAAFSLATLCKWNLAFTLPWFWLRGTRTLLERLGRLALLVAVLPALGALAYAPFWRGPESVAGPFRALQSKTMVPGGSVVDGVGALFDAAHGVVSDATLPVVGLVERERARREGVWRVAEGLMGLLALWAVLGLGLSLRRGFDEERLALVSGAFVVALVTLASPKFQSWYLMSALPFFGRCCPGVWRRWWVWVVAASVTEEFFLALPRSAALFAPCVALSTLATVLAFLSSLRERYWALPPGPLDAAWAHTAGALPGPPSGRAS
ncbi:MAG: hypothetical protein ACLPJH_05855 [Myxococcaceae bacterium]